MAPTRRKSSATKPPYRVSLMSELRPLPCDAPTVASTFSGCGGSCLGFRLAGFRHVYANEFVARARETYAANFPGVHLDGRDIRDVKPENVLKVAGLRVGELDVFEGSPPCQAFSTAGTRHRGWGKNKDHGGGVKGGAEDLFFEYVRLLRGLKPRAFVAENVSGLVKGVAKGYFLEILRELKACGYRVECRILDAQWLGVPQQRTRTIFVGVREDLRRDPMFPAPLSYRYSISDAIPWIVGVEFRTGSRSGNWNPYNKTFDVSSEPINTIPKTAPGASDKEGWLVTDAKTPRLPPSYVKKWVKLKHGEADSKRFGLIRTDPGKPTPTITVSTSASVTHPHEPRKFTIAELRRLGGFPDDFVLTGSFAEQWARVGNSVPPPMMRAVAEVIRDRILK